LVYNNEFNGNYKKRIPQIIVKHIIVYTFLFGPLLFSKIQAAFYGNFLKWFSNIYLQAAFDYYFKQRL